MAENQSVDHKEAYWRRVVLKWVKCADLNTSYESIDLDTCYSNFRCKINAYYDLHESTVAEFLRVQFPDFELELNKENEIPKCDAVYVFSMMLYFSCIRHPVSYFQNIGQTFDAEYQRSMAAFLNSFVSEDGNQIVINRSFLDKAFQNAKPLSTVLSENLCSISDRQQMITSTPSGKFEMKKPSPTTPKSVALEWKVKNLSAMIETAQAENINQEKQIERLLQNVKQLQEEKKMYQMKIDVLQLKETCACGNNLRNISNASNRVTEQLQKQLEAKHNEIEMLQEELSLLKESASMQMERYTTMKKQFALFDEDNRRMKIVTEELKKEIIMKETCNQNLLEIVKDLRRFISENQIKGAGLMELLESSFEVLDQSFKNMSSDDSQCYDSENLASTVVDIKLKEKEHELEAMSKKTQELEDNLKAMIEDLNRQMESQKKAHLEEQSHLQIKLNESDAKLKQTLADAEKDKSLLVEAIEKGKDEIQDLNRQLQERERLMIELNANTAELRQALTNAEKEKSMLTEDLKESKAFINDLNSQLESQKKAHMEKHESLQAEMSQKTAELRQALSEAEKEKSQLTEALEKGKINMEELNRQLQEHGCLQTEMSQKTAELRQALMNGENEKSQLTKDLDKDKIKIADLSRQLQEQESLVIELNENTAELRQALTNAEKEKSKLIEDLEEGKALINDLNSQLESQKKAHLEKHERLQAEMSQKIVELRQALTNAEKEKSKLTEDLKESKALINDLNSQLESQKKAHLEKHERLQAEMSQKTAELRQALSEAEKEKSQLTEALEKGKINMEELNRQLQEHGCLQTEMSQKTAELRQALANAENEKSQLTKDLDNDKIKIADLSRQLQEQESLVIELNENTAELRQALTNAEKEKSKLTEDLEKGKALINDLNSQLESQKKAHLENQERLQAEMSQKTAELRQTLSEAEKEKSQLTEALEKGKINMEELNRQLQEHGCLQTEMSQKTAELRQALTNAEKEKSQLTKDLDKDKIKIADLSRQLHEQENLVIELNENTAELRQALTNAEKEKSKLTEDLEEGKALINDLNSQLESQKKAHLEKHERLQAEMSQKTAELRQALSEAEKEKSQLTEVLEKGKINMEKLNRQLQEHGCLQTEMSQKTAELRQALTNGEKEKSMLTEDLKESKALIINLNSQLESQEKAHLEKKERLQAETTQKTAELRQALSEAEKEKSQLTEALEEGKVLIKELNSQLDSEEKAHQEKHERLQLEMNQEIAALREKLAAAEKKESQLAENVEKGKVKMEDLNRQLQAHECLQTELNRETAGLRQALDATEKAKSFVTEELEKDKALIKELQNQLQDHERLQAELTERNAAFAEAEKVKSQLEDDLGKEQTKTEYLNHQLEQMEKTKLLHEQSNTNQHDEMVRQISTLQQKLDQEQEKSEEVNCQYVQAKRQSDDLQVQCTKLMQQLSAERNKIANLQQQLATKDAKLNELSVLHEETVKQLEKSTQDSEILGAKLFKARQTLKEKEELWLQERTSMANTMEEKLRDARIEHDSKMAKMKDRMVELHKEGKTKLECDNQGLLLTVDGYRRKVENLEIRCAKLQQQLAEMNERNLEVRKENQLLLIRIKSLDEFGTDRKSVLLPSQANLRNNFKMEDEEGELFNNMYLADLKNGRCVSPVRPSSSKGGLNRYSELSQRNSMVLPHLRTHYVALDLECEPPQDDTRDNMSTTFDDSSTGLISRRKVSGITSYKRPGPPTPSKRAGRLSLTGALSGNLGGGEVQYKEVLRDANANMAVGGGGGGGAAAAGIVGPAAESAARTARTKTPGKFKQMISSSSLLNNFQRDEDNTFALLKGTGHMQRCTTDNNIPPKKPPNTRTRANVVAKQKRLQRKLAFDSNRCLGEFSPSTPPFTVDKRAAIPLDTIRPTTDYYSSRTPTLIDITAAAPTSSTTATATATVQELTTDVTLVEPIPVSDYSFKHPYGCTRYNIGRKMQSRRKNRHDQYDKTRNLQCMEAGT